MQRFEPREFVAAALAAVAPLAWLAAVRAGVVPDVFDTDAGAAFGVAVAHLRAGASVLPAAPLAALLAAGSGLSLAAATRLAFGAALWSAGYGGWRVARTFAPASGALGGLLLGLTAQLGPWTLEPLGLGPLGAAQLAALTVGPALLGLAHPRLAALVGLASPGTGVVVAAVGLVRRRWSAALGLVGIVPLFGAVALGGAYADPAPPRTVPTYAGTAGAWFPLPPAESAKWVAASAAYDGRWVHPLSAAVSGLSGDARPTTALPLAVEAAAVPAASRWVAPSVWAAGRLPEGAARAWVRGSGLESGLVPLAALALVGAAVLGGRRRGALAGVAGASVAAGVAVAWPAPAAAPRLGTAALLAAAEGLDGAAVVLFPPPEAPYRAGRVSEVQAALLLAAAGASPGAADHVDLATLGRLTGYGFDTEAAQVLSETAAPAGLGEIDTVLLVDVPALPPWTWTELRRAFAAAGATLSGEGPLVAVRFLPALATEPAAAPEPAATPAPSP